MYLLNVSGLHYNNTNDLQLALQEVELYEALGCIKCLQECLPTYKKMISRVIMSFEYGVHRKY